MNIVFINPEYPSCSTKGHGGIATYIYTMAQVLTAEGHCVHILVRKGTACHRRKYEYDCHTFTHIPVKNALTFLYRRIDGSTFWEQGCSNGALQTIMQLHKKTPIDIVEIPEYHGLAKQFFQPLPFPVVINFHTPTIIIDTLNQMSYPSVKKRWYTFEKKAIYNGTGFRCPSRSLADKISSLYSISKEKIKIIRNPIDTRCFDELRMGHQEKKSIDRLNILFTGRLEKRKGAEIILHAVRGIFRRFSSVTMTIAGETIIDNAPNYQTLIEKNLGTTYRNRIRFLGSMDRERLLSLYKCSDIFIIPSLFENAPYTVLEAMAAKLPVLGTDTGGVNEMIRHNETGLLFSKTNTNDMYRCIDTLIANPSLSKNISENAYTYIKTFHNPLTIAKETIAFYTEIIEKHQSV